MYVRFVIIMSVILSLKVVIPTSKLLASFCVNVVHVDKIFWLKVGWCVNDSQ